VCAGEDRTTDHIHILFNGGGDDRLRGASDTRVDHLKPFVTQAAREHLRAAIVAVEARLCDQDSDRCRSFSHLLILPRLPAPLRRKVGRMRAYGGSTPLRVEAKVEMAEIKHTTDASFEADVANSPRPVIVDFWAPWCGPCKLVAPELEKLAAQYDGAVDIVKVNVDENPSLQRAFNIMSIPTIAFFKGAGAQPVGAVGFQTAEQLEARFGLKELAAK